MKLFVCVFVILLLVPFSQAFSAEKTDTLPTLSVSLMNETFVYRDSEGYTVVVGLVENNNTLTPVSNVRLKVNFFDDYDPNPLEVIEGHTTLEVILPNGKSPYSIRSQTPNLDITQASVSLLGFDSSVAKQKGLRVYSSDISLDTTFRFSGVLQNGGAPNSNTNVYLAFYDAFEPPRILRVSTIELGHIDSNSEVSFNFNEKIDSRAIGIYLFAESDVFVSDMIDVKIPPSHIATKLVTISNVSVEDLSGDKLSELKVGSTVNIKSQTLIEFVEDQKPAETAYTYYVQIKKTSDNPDTPGIIEYIGKYNGRFIDDGSQTQIIDWIPQQQGLFYIETFVWDRNNIPIADQGPVSLIFVN